MIVKTFEDLSRDIWTNTNLANKYRTLYGEETITDSILLELAKQKFLNIRILQTSKHLEAFQGTDWEWYVGSHKYGWIRYAIQAKKLNLKFNRYQSLNHRNTQSKNNSYQVNLLRKYADANGAVPLYNFYNYYLNADKNQWKCHKPFDRKLLGWTFTPLNNVETAINTRNSRTFEKIHEFKNTLPIRCLFSCPYFKSLYFDQKTIGSNGDFFGEKFRKIRSLPDTLLYSFETEIIDHFPQELYNPEIKIYPKRVAIIELNEEELQPQEDINKEFV